MVWMMVEEFFVRCGGRIVDVVDNFLDWMVGGVVLLCG